MIGRVGPELATSVEAGAIGEPRVGDLGPPSLTTAEAVGQTLAVGPIFSAGLLAGTVAVFAGFNTPLSVLVAGVGTLALSFVLVLYGRRFAGAGAVYEYLARGVHSSVGIVGAGTYLLGLLFLGAGGGFVTEGYLVNQLLSTELQVDLGWWVWALVALVVVIGVNYVGVRVGVAAVMSTAAISSIPFFVIAIAIVVQGGENGNSLAVFDPSRTSSDAVFHGILFAITLFIGFETVASLGEEARMPRRSIPLAMVSSIAICTAFYLFVTYAGTIGFGERALRNDAWFASGNPFGELGDRYVGGRALDWIVDVTIVLDLLSVLIAFTLAASRLLMTTARDGLLPRAIAELRARTARKGRQAAQRNRPATWTACEKLYPPWKGSSHQKDRCEPAHGLARQSLVGIPDGRFEELRRPSDRMADRPAPRPTAWQG